MLCSQEGEIKKSANVRALPGGGGLTLRDLLIPPRKGGMKRARGGEDASPYRGRGGKKRLIFTGFNQARDVELGPYFFVVPKNKLAGTDLCTP